MRSHKKKVRKKSKISFLKKIFISIFLLICIILSVMIYKVYTMIYHPNVSLGTKKTTYFYIPTNSTLQDVTRLLYEKNYIINRNSFEWLAEQKKYAKKIRPGKYLLREAMNNNELVNLLRSGRQVPLDITFNALRTKEQLVYRLTKKLEADSARLITLLNNPEWVAQYGFTPSTIMAFFIPNTYQFYWNTSAEQIFERMANEYKKFWNEERKIKSKQIGLTQTEVSILASIVQEETIKNDEKLIVAGVYINRLRKGIKLQADPTVIYAVGDYTIRRVLKVHKEVDSPYNTYMYSGLPPGPIVLASASSIDAVLNYKHHNYIFFCAKEDFSGYHNFAATYSEHQKNARKYQKELNKRNIMN